MVTRIDHHAGFELLDLADLGGLLVGLEIAMDDADAAGLRHGDRHLDFGHGIHGRGDDRDIERDLARDAGADIDVRRQHVGQARLEQDVVEGERFAQATVAFLVHRQLQVAPSQARRGAVVGFELRPVLPRNKCSRANRRPFWVGGGR